MQQRSFFAALLAIAAAASAADWLTDGGNPQRTAWQRDEKILNRENVRNLQIVWKLKLDNQPREMHSLFPPLIVGSLKTPGGLKQVAIEAGISDNLYAIDVEKGEILWRKHFESTYTPPPNARPRRSAVSRRTNRHARHRTRGCAGPPHRLRRGVGRTPARDQCRRWRRPRPAREVHAAQRQALCVESLA